MFDVTVAGVVKLATVSPFMKPLYTAVNAGRVSPEVIVLLSAVIVNAALLITPALIVVKVTL